ncbi:MAG TPA: sugar ABC transporter substrate-binding protein [Miltoncostaeaceae bacterium]|nr:sugar ABC transporter substrate-binding protein [Miltoncostaeaceae bacterium]
MRVRSKGGAIAAIAAAGVIALGLSACGGDDDDSGAADTAGGASSAGGKIALLLPETQNARYETKDRPLFEAKVKALCPNCEVIYSNADQDAAKQQQQAEAAITNGAKVLVLDAVDAGAAQSTVAQADAKGIPVIAYDRQLLGKGIDYYNSYDNAKVGELQAQALVDKLKADGKTSGTIVMINGAPTDNNAKLFKQGAHKVLDASGYKIGAEYDTPNWTPSEAQKEMDQAISKLGKNGFIGVYAANDGTAGGAIAALKAAGIDPSTIPVTGQDAELAAIQRILAGEQFMTVYKAIKPQAEDAATAAVNLLNGQPLGLETTPVNNGTEDVPSSIYDPVSVTKDNVKDTIVADGFWPVSDICTGPFAAACTAAGIQ